MRNQLLVAPIDRYVLDRVIKTTGQAAVASIDTYHWLLRHPNRDDMVREIRAAWSRSRLPLRDWSAMITDVQVWADDRVGELWLEIKLSKLECNSLLQKAPYDPADYDACVQSYPLPVPSIVRDFALAAPGLQVVDIGPLVSPAFLRNRMGQMHKWNNARNITPKLCAQYGCVFADPEQFLMEIANNGQGCCYVLRNDGCIFYHDYGDLPGLVPCNIQLDEFIAAYFRNPHAILDPYASGWATYPGRV